MRNCSLREFHTRHSIIPFEAGFAVFCVYNGIISIIGFGLIPNILRTVIGYNLSMIFDIGFLVAGIAMFFGSGLGRRDLESVGLITVATSLLIRSVIVGYLMGFSPIIFNSYISNFIFICCCLARLSFIMKNKAILQVNLDIPIEEQIQYDKPISIN